MGCGASCPLLEVFFYTKFNLGALCVAVVRSWEVVALRGFLKQLFQWEWRSVPLSLAAVGCLVALWELVVERFDCSPTGRLLTL